MVEAVQEALGRLGIDEVVAAGMFFPRGHSGQRASDAASGLPERMRVNVRVVELIDETSSSRVELEGERLPGFHVSDVIDALQS